MFKFLFKRREPTATAAAAAAEEPVAAAPVSTGAAAPGTAIRFSADLIPRLKDDHQQLLAIFGNIDHAFQDKNYEGVAKHLDEFRIAIQGHLLMEKVRLYIYLEHQLAGDAARHDVIHGFRHEMDGIGKAVTGFLGKYRNIAMDERLASSFGEELTAVGKVLADRIRREEETLYPLYAPA